MERILLRYWWNRSHTVSAGIKFGGAVHQWAYKHYKKQAKKMGIKSIRPAAWAA